MSTEKMDNKTFSSGRGGRGRGRQGGRGRGVRDYNGDPKHQFGTKDDGSIPILKYGPSSNFIKFRERLSEHAIKEYGNLGLLIETDEYYEPPEINDLEFGSFEEYEDQLGVNKMLYTQALKERAKEITKMRTQRPNLYAMITMKLSAESKEEVKSSSGYEEFNKQKDPLRL